MARYPHLFYSVSLIITVTLASFVSSCSPFYDDRSECEHLQERDALISFYVQTPCDNEPLHPSEIQDISLFLFDAETHLLVSQQHYVGSAVSQDYAVKVKFQPEQELIMLSFGVECLKNFFVFPTLK